MSLRRVLGALAGALLVGAFTGSNLSAQAQEGTIIGQVLESASGQPIPAAQISVVGTTQGAVTNNLHA